MQQSYAACIAADATTDAEIIDSRFAGVAVATQWWRACARAPRQRTRARAPPHLRSAAARVTSPHRPILPPYGQRRRRIHSMILLTFFQCLCLKSRLLCS